MRDNTGEVRQGADDTEERAAGTSGSSGSLIGPNSVGPQPSSAQPAIPEPAMADATEARGDQAQTGPVDPVQGQATPGGRDTVFQKPDPGQLKPDSSQVSQPPLDEDKTH